MNVASRVPDRDGWYVPHTFKKTMSRPTTHSVSATTPGAQAPAFTFGASNPLSNLAGGGRQGAYIQHVPYTTGYMNGGGMPSSTFSPPVLMQQHNPRDSHRELERRRKIVIGVLTHARNAVRNPNGGRTNQEANLASLLIALFRGKPNQVFENLDSIVAFATMCVEATDVDDLKLLEVWRTTIVGHFMMPQD